MKTIQFIKQCGIYNRNEVHTFPDSIADLYIARRVAVVVQVQEAKVDTAPRETTDKKTKRKRLL